MMEKSNNNYWYDEKIKFADDVHSDDHNHLTPFQQILEEIQAMHDKKQADYGKKGDPFANVRASEEWGIPGWVGCMTRATDKIKRLQAAARGQNLVNESIEDSLLDLATYTIIALCLFREENGIQ